jgi:ABC-type glycerol-3-phosphate transport system permease component
VGQSLKVAENIYLDPLLWIPDPVAWSNYREIFESGPVWSWTSNFTLVTVVTVIARTASSTLVAYGFARFSFAGNQALFILLLSSLI